MKIIIKGRIPSKKNSKIMVCRGKIPILLPSSNYSKWHKDISEQIKDIKRISNVKSMILEFYLPDNRRTDLSNKAESILDLLVDNEIIEDDNWKIIPELILRGIEVDKENPRVEIIFLV